MEFCYPQGKHKALTFSYDDGEIHDRRLIEIFDKYEIKATFNLNSGWLDTEGYITKAEIPELYKNHEVACHGVNHRYLRHMNCIDILRELEDDRRELEGVTGKFVKGFAYAFGESSPEAVRILKDIGICYARTADTTGKFYAPDNFLMWNPTCHHDEDMFGFLETLKNPPDYLRMPLLYVYGHSFEFARNNNWERIEEFCSKASGDSDIWYATNMDIYRYFTAIKRLNISMDGKRYWNDSTEAIWFYDKEEKLCSIKPGEEWEEKEA